MSTLQSKCETAQEREARVRSRRWKRQRCGYRYTPEPKGHRYDQAVHTQAIRPYVDRLSYRRIARQLRVSYQSVVNWCRAPSASLPAQAPLRLNSRYAERNG
mgnify:CR=1 FL=1